MALTFRSEAYIDGVWVSGPNSFSVLNPANQEVVGEVPDLGAAETQRAIDAAHAAFPAWSGKIQKERSAILRKWRRSPCANMRPRRMAPFIRR